MMKGIQGQRGAVLIVSLILLLLITAIAVSMMSSSTFQTAMTINAQQREAVFREAESAAEQPFTKNLLNSAYNAYLQHGNVPTAFNVPVASLSNTRSTDITMSAQLFFMGEASGPAKDEELNKFKIWIYESRGSATSVDNKMATQVVQGGARLTYTGAASDTYDP